LLSGDGAASAARAPGHLRGGAARPRAAVAVAARGAPTRRPRRRARVPRAPLLPGAPPVPGIRLAVLGFADAAWWLGFA